MEPLIKNLGSNNVRIEKIEVCQSCLSAGMVNPSCECAFGEYEAVLLEFEVCNCCGNIINDGDPADTPFNTKQLEKTEQNGKSSNS